VASYTLFDVNVGYPVPGLPGASLQLAVQNLFDEGYRSFPGVPQVGRMALLRLRYEFP
jgi:outer membrane receptor protein involved in Fe transport